MEKFALLLRLQELESETHKLKLYIAMSEAPISSNFPRDFSTEIRKLEMPAQPVVLFNFAEKSCLPLLQNNMSLSKFT